MNFKKNVKKTFHWIRAMCLDLCALIACLILYPLYQFFQDPKQNECVPDATPTLLVHGYLHNSSAWACFRYRLKRQGIKNVFTINLGNPFLSIEDYANIINQKIIVIKELTGRNDIQLMGHSMGGVVCAYYATHQAQEPNCEIRWVITLGSPLNGTKLRGIGPAADQMHFRSDFIRSLKQEILKSSIPFFHVGSETDQIILPSSSTVIKEKPFVMLNNIGHLSFLFSCRVFNYCLVYFTDK